MIVCCTNNCRTVQPVCVWRELVPACGQSQLVAMENQPAEYWIKHLGLVEHPGKEDGYFAVPFEDTFSVRNRKQVQGRTRWPQ